jgi:MobA/MobL family
MSSGHYHLHLHPISKCKGHTIQAAWAYRHAERITAASAAAAYRHAQERGNRDNAFDYRGKVGVEWFGIVAPTHAPDWCRDSRKLWAKVDETEHRRNARLAQEIIIALPHTLDLDQHIAMMTEFAARYCVAPYAMVADVAIHAPPVHRGGDPRNFHAHILLTDRPMTLAGFAKHKDRRYSDKGLVDEFRVGWTLVHNRTMERLGLPHRIDHRRLDVQLQEAVARGDEANAILFDRIPQIHLGKAAHCTHPRATVYQDRVRLNRSILAANTELHEARQRDTHRQHHHAALAASDEKARIDYQRAIWQPEPASIEVLEKTYGRKPATSILGKLKDKAFAGDASRLSMAISRRYGHPWNIHGDRPGAPPVFDVLKPMIKGSSPGHPVFTVTARDIAFALYKWGWISRRNLQDSLENVVQEEQQQFADRVSKQKAKVIWPQPLLKPKPLEHATPMRALAATLESRLGCHQAATALHHARHAAFERRYVQRQVTRVGTMSHKPGLIPLKRRSRTVSSASLIRSSKQDSPESN